jgi:hypothetical protein
MQKQAKGSLPRSLPLHQCLDKEEPGRGSYHQQPKFVSQLSSEMICSTMKISKLRDFIELSAGALVVAIL